VSRASTMSEALFGITLMTQGGHVGLRPGDGANGWQPDRRPLTGQCRRFTKGHAQRTLAGVGSNTLGASPSERQSLDCRCGSDGLAARIGRFGGTDLTVSAGQRRCANPVAYPNCRSRRRSCRGPLLLCSRALLGSDVNRSIRSAGRKRVGVWRAWHIAASPATDCGSSYPQSCGDAEGSSRPSGKPPVSGLGFDNHNPVRREALPANPSPSTTTA
jgi:hypothetical protein